MQINDHLIEVLGMVFFALAVIHTFLTRPILNYAHHFPKGSFREGMLHLLSEIEVVFGIWAAAFLVLFGILRGFGAVTLYFESLKFIEPLFVFCIMLVSASRPIMNFVHNAIDNLGSVFSKLLRIEAVYCDLFFVMTLGSLSGSFITEPAAMTISALLILKIFEKTKSRLNYVMLGTMFVNVSIGGSLSHFAAPPVLMVAKAWNLDFEHMLTTYGWKSVLAVIINSLIVLIVFRKQIKKDCRSLTPETGQNKIPRWITMAHYLCLAGIVASSHYPNTCFALLLLFLGLTTVTKKYQRPLRFRESGLVAFFLGGIITFGAFQEWWLGPVLTRLDELELYFSAVALTAVTDNAALTYLGSLVPTLTDSSRYSLLAGALAGGGLTIIANAPNVVGYSILQEKFPGGLSPLRLFLAALTPTIVAVACLGFL